MMFNFVFNYLLFEGYKILIFPKNNKENFYKNKY